MYIDFCSNFSISPLPASEETLLRYMTSLYYSGRKSATISGHLSAIRHFHLVNGAKDPLEGKDRLALVKRGMAKRASTAELRAAVIALE